MKNSIPLLLGSFVLLITPIHAEDLASEVMQASGAAHWPSVERIQFTFRVVANGVEKVSAKHDWDLVKNTDTVSWAGKTVTVDVVHPGVSAEEKSAFQRWTNDAYWLLAPLKLRDAGATLEQPDAHSLAISFNGVGLTPGDHYLFEIDPANHLPKSWSYMPRPGVSNPATWEKYVNSGGLTLSTYHKMGGAEIFIDDLRVTPAR